MTKALHPFVLTVQITSTVSTRNDILQIARSQLGPLQVTPGCLDIRLYEDVENPGTFHWEEKWSCRELLEKRVASDRFRTILAMVDISNGIPDITINKVTNEKGMDWISKIRGKQLLQEKVV